MCGGQTQSRRPHEAADERPRKQRPPARASSGHRPMSIAIVNDRARAATARSSARWIQSPHQRDG